MAAGRLTGKQIVDLSQIITPDAMETIAEGQMDIDHERVKIIKRDNTENAEGVTKDILRYWASKNDVDDQVKKLEDILCTAAKGHGNIDPKKVRKVLSITSEGTATGRTDTTQSVATPQTGHEKSDGCENNQAGGPELTEKMLDLLAEWIADETELRKLAIQGLGIPDRVVTRQVEENKLSIAVVKVLKIWRRDAGDGKNAYVSLSTALERNGMSYYKEKALK